MRYWILLAALLTGGCSTSFLTFEPLQALQEPKAVEVREGVLQPQRSVNQLLLERLAVCNTPPEEQDAVLNKLLTTDQKPPANGVDENKLDALMLASCRPARTPGVLNQLLADLTAEGTWPEEYAAFFDLMIAGQRAYASVEKVYVDLEKAYGDLKHEHEKTIQGLSEIEAQIEMQTVKSIP
jgi:hypothetical protein